MLVDVVRAVGCGRQTDDELLQQVEAAWAKVEELEARQRDGAAGGMLRRRNWERMMLSDEQEDEAAARYVATWRVGWIAGPSRAPRQRATVDDRRP